MKQHQIVLMVDSNTTKTFIMPAHNYKDKSYICGKSSSLILHSGSVDTIIWSDDFLNSNIQVSTINILMKFNSFI